MNSSIHRKTSDCRLKFSRNFRIDYSQDSLRKTSNEPTTMHREMRIRRIATEKTTSYREIYLESKNEYGKKNNTFSKLDSDISLNTRNNRRTLNGYYKTFDCLNVEHNMYHIKKENNQNAKNIHMFTDVKQIKKASINNPSLHRNTEVFSKEELKSISLKKLTLEKNDEILSEKYEKKIPSRVNGCTELKVIDQHHHVTRPIDSCLPIHRDMSLYSYNRYQRICNNKNSSESDNITFSDMNLGEFPTKPSIQEKKARMISEPEFMKTSRDKINDLDRMNIDLIKKCPEISKKISTPENKIAIPLYNSQISLMNSKNELNKESPKKINVNNASSCHKKSVLCDINKCKQPNESILKKNSSPNLHNFTNLKKLVSSELNTEFHQIAFSNVDEIKNFDKMNPLGVHSPKAGSTISDHHEEHTINERVLSDDLNHSLTNSDGIRLEEIQRENKKLREEMLDIKRSARDYRELTEKLVSELVEIRCEIVKKNFKNNYVIEDESNMINNKDINNKFIKDREEGSKVKEKNLRLSIVDKNNVRVVLNNGNSTGSIDNITSDRPRRKKEIFGKLGKIFKSMTTPERIKNKNEIFSQISQYYKTIKGEISCQTDRSFTEKEMKISNQRFHDIFSSQMERVGLGGLELDDLRSCEVDTTIISPKEKKQIQNARNTSCEKIKKSRIDIQNLQPNTKITKKKKKKKARKIDLENILSNLENEPQVNSPLMITSQSSKVSGHTVKKVSL